MDNGFSVQVVLYVTEQLMNMNTIYHYRMTQYYNLRDGTLRYAP